jgi:hypothetical protein
MKNQTEIRRKNNSRAGDVQCGGGRKSSRRLSSSELIFLSEIYDRLDEKPFRDAIAEFNALAELLSENYAPEVQAIKRMVQAESELNRIRKTVHKI